MNTIFLKINEGDNENKVVMLLRKIVAAKLDYITETTGNTETIIVPSMDTKYIVSDSFLSVQSLGFITQVKKHAEKTAIDRQPFESKDINYYKISSQEREGVYYDVCEVDVNGAYWEIAKRLGYIDEKIYQKGLTVDKKTRLIALGAMATVKRCIQYTYDKGANKYNYEYLGDRVNETTRSYFFHIAKTLDVLMNQFIQENGANGIYLYWVDAFFVDTYRAREIEEFFKLHGLAVKRKNIAAINCKIKKSTKKIYCIEVEERTGTRTDIRIKPFFEIDEKVRRRQSIAEFKKIITETA